MENLEDYLQHEVSQGQLDSSGHFTLSADRALAKLGHFQLPSSALWLCKLLQAAVASGSSGFSVSLLHRETLVYAKWPGIWTPELVAEALSNPDPGLDRGLWHLKQAFWSVALHEGRIFSLQLQHWNDVLVWDGLQLRVKSHPTGEAVLRVSQWIRDEKKPTGLFGRSDWSRRNADLMQEMRKRCFASPIPVEVDRMRLDALHLCPIHGHGERSTLLHVDSAENQLPPLPLPQSGANPKLPQQAGLFGLLAGHFWLKGSSLIHEVHRCAVHWIKDGLALDTRTFLDMPARSCSFGFVASAEGLDLDLSGMKLLDSQPFKTRLSQVVLAAAPLVARTHPDFGDFVRRAQATRKGEEMAIGALGFGLLWIIPPIGIGLLGVSAFRHFKQSPTDQEKMSIRVNADLSQLKADFQKLVRQASSQA